MHLDAEALEALLGALPGQPLRHLLTCARCRRRVNAILFDLTFPDADDLPFVGTTPALPPPPQEDDDATALRQTLLLRAIELAEADDRRAAESPEARLASNDLLALPSELRLEGIATESRFRTLAVAEILLGKARESSPEDPIGSRDLAGLATAILENLDSTVRRSRLEAEASCLLGEAERRLGRLDLAEDLFKNAAYSLRDQPLILEARATLCRSWAALRQEQGRVDEALGLLERASMIAEELGGFRELALARLAYGWLLLDEFDTERAILPLQEVLSLLDPGQDPYAIFSALHALAIVYAELGDEDHLADVLSALDGLAPSLPDLLDFVRIRWIKARVAWRQANHDEAISALGEVFAQLLSEGPGMEAAAAGLELARMAAERNPDESSLAETLERIARPLTALPPERLAPHLLPVLRFALGFPARRAGAYLDVLLSAAAYLERARFNPAYLYHPTPEPELTLVWSDLSGSQRRRAALAAGVELDRSGYPRTSEEQLLISWTHEALTGVRILLTLDLDADETRPG
jgi:tetratricopeptide (TPR) repeat protein